MTGDDINLLSSAGFPLYKGGQRHSTNPSYTFEAKTTDYASRFRLVYSICGDANGDNETFAFISNGVTTGTPLTTMPQVRNSSINSGPKPPTKCV